MTDSTELGKHRAADAMSELLCLIQMNRVVMLITISVRQAITYQLYDRPGSHPSAVITNKVTVTLV